MQEEIVEFIREHTLEELTKGEKYLLRSFLRSLRSVDSYSMTYTQPEFILETIKGMDVSTLHVDYSVTKTED